MTEQASPAQGVEVIGINEHNKQAVEHALNAIAAKFPERSTEMLNGVVIEIGDDLTESGGEADEQNKRIILDAAKNARSLQDVENQLVKEGLLKPGDWTNLLPDIKDEPWSTLSYNLVHELGHIVGGHLPPELSPTKYGRVSASENDAFPEAFTSYVYGGEIDALAKEYIEKNYGEL